MAGANREVEAWRFTRSVCPECLQVIPAEKAVREDGIYLEKTCPGHGSWSTLIWEGSREDYLAWGREMSPADRLSSAGSAGKGCPYDCGLCEAHERRGCCVLLEVTGRCNLNCPVCFAGAGDGGSDVPLEELGRQMEELMSAGGPFNLQLSGGEPTVRDDLPEILRLGKEKGFSFFQLNTNGLRLAGQPEYAEELKEAGLSCVFLQFDGLNDEIYRTLRGRELWREKQAAIEACERAGLGVVLVPVIAPGVNEDQMGKILSYAVSRMPAVRGVHFQPISYFGRCLEPTGGYRLTIPKILGSLEEQTGGVMKAGDFIGGNATNPYCTFQANYLRQEDGSLKPMRHGTARAYAASEQAREFVARQWSGAGALPEDGGCCCCESEEPSPEGGGCCESAEVSPEGGCCCGESEEQKRFDISSLDEFLVKIHRNTFAVSGMLFQDVYNLDLERLKRCYILEADLRYGVVPFCAYNLTDRKGKTLYR